MLCFWFQGVAEDMSKHISEASEYHLSLALNKISTQDEKIKNQNDEIQSMKLTQEKILEKLKTIESKPAAVSSTPFSDEHTWKIYQCLRKLEKAQEEYGFSLTRRFYTSQGHKIKIEFYPNGDEEYGNYAAILFSTDTGSFDDTLKWPMKAKIEFSAIDGYEYPAYDGSIDTKSGAGRNFHKPPHNCDGHGNQFFIPIRYIGVLPDYDDCVFLEIKVNFVSKKLAVRTFWLISLEGKKI